MHPASHTVFFMRVLHLNSSQLPILKRRNRTFDKKEIKCSNMTFASLAVFPPTRRFLELSLIAREHGPYTPEAGAIKNPLRQEND